MITTYTVTGMTCGHCALSVREEVEAVAGVTAVDVNHETGILSVTADSVDDAAISAAVAEAGFTLTGRA